MEWSGHLYGYPWHLWRCRWFPWLPRWWWTGMYGPITPYMGVPREQEIALLEAQRRAVEQELQRIRKRLKELKKEEVTQ